MKTTHISFTETGRRKENQDYFKIQEFGHNKKLFVLADGMGGHTAGHIASKTVCDAFCEYWEKHLESGFPESFINEVAIQVYNILKNQADIRKGEMGATVVGVYIENDHAYIFHCGDSRCYLFRKAEGCIFQTIDHTDFTLGWEVFNRCFFSNKPEKAIPEIRSFELNKADRLFLCTDGVHKRLRSSSLEKTLNTDKSIESIINDVKDLCESYSDDNYSGILIELF